MTVLEHLLNPLDVLVHLHSHLNKGGLLIFNFILSDGQGLDTKAAVSQREAVVQFIAKNFLLESGTLEVNKSIGTTVARKK